MSGDRTAEEAKKLLRHLMDVAKLDHAIVYLPGTGDVMVELPKAGKR